MGKFNLAELIAQGSVPDLGTADKQEKIEYIDIMNLDDDPRNFYALDGVESLASNIQLLGLQQPLRVRSNPDAQGRFIIVSGHRRRAALQMLVDSGEQQYRDVPCIQEKSDDSKAMQELRLIYANSDTRTLTSAETSRQAERVEALLYQLKEEGVEFPGRMRDYVAEACQISKSKLARLKVIREGLIPDVQSAWESGTISESTAYRLAQESPDVQDKLCAQFGHKLPDMTQWQIDQQISQIKAPKKAPNKPISMERKTAEAYLSERAAEDVYFLQAMRDYGFDWLLRYLSGTSTRHMGIEALKRGPAFSHAGGGTSTYDIRCEPKYLDIRVPPAAGIKRSWTEVWDAMAVVALERAAAAAERAEEFQPVGQLVFNGWMPGGTSPSEACEVVAIFEIDGERVKRLLFWDGKVFHFHRTSRAEIDIQPSKWMALPPDEEE